MLPNYKDIVDLIKKGSNVEAQEKIMELREGALELQEQNIALTEQVAQLEAALQLQGEMIFKRTVYWRECEGAEPVGPFCSTCYDNEGKTIRLHDWDDSWFCRVCNNFPLK